MAGFKTHITVSTCFGAGYGAAGALLMGFPLPSCVLAGGLCSVAGMLPDLDSGPGKPLRESMAFAAAVVPMLMFDRARHMGLSPETMALAGGAIYLFIRFGLHWALSKYTVHRGMFHSIPAAIIATELAFLICATSGLEVRIYKAGGVLIGFMSHLLLDELYSVQWTGFRFRFKKSFGTAVKFVGDSLWANISTYAKLALLTFVVLNDPVWIDHTHPNQQIQMLAGSLLERIKQEYFEAPQTEVEPLLDEEGLPTDAPPLQARSLETIDQR